MNTRMKTALKSVALPSDYTTSLPPNAHKVLYKYGIKPDLLKEYGVGYSPYLDTIVYPLYDLKGNLKGVQYRSVIDRVDFPKYVTKGSKPPYLCINKNQNNNILCLTEDILSAIKVSEYCDSMSLLGTSIKQDHIKTIINSNYDKVIIWLDNDKAGIEGASKISKALKMYGVNVEVIFSTRDPKDAWHKEIKERII